MYYFYINIISADDFLNNILNGDITFFIILNNLNVADDTELLIIYLMSAIAELILFNNYQNFTDIFFEENAAKHNLIKNIYHEF